MNKFRPQQLHKSYTIKHRLKYGRVDNVNWQTRVRWYPAGWGVNKRVIGDQFIRLHYLACHAPEPIQKKWARAYQLFYSRRFPTHKASMRYANAWSCHSWL